MPIRRLKLIVPADAQGVRLDQWLSSALEKEWAMRVSRGAIRKQMVAGAVYLNSKQVRIASKPLIPGARVEVFWNTELETAVSSVSESIEKAWEIKTLYEDEWIWVVNKPAGLPSQPTLDPSRPSLYTELQKRTPYVGLHHRLDRDTSGVILFTKKKDANIGVAALFREHRIQKTYHALVSWLANARDPIWPSVPWKTQSYLKAKHLTGKRKQMVSVKSGGDFAETDFEILEKFGTAALIQARPKTGRMHQIRAHALENAFPLIGDPLYQGITEWQGEKIPRVMLHAVRVEFVHPISGRAMSVDAPIPEDFSRWLTVLKKN